MNEQRRAGRRLVAAAAAAPAAAKLAAGASGAALTALAVAVALLGWLAVLAGSGASANCTPSDTPPERAGNDIPAELRPIFTAASQHYALGASGPAVLAALTKVESDFGRNMGPSSAGAVGWTQFLPSTWRHYGVDANGDGRRDPYDPHDSIHAAANYLHASGAPGDWYRALFTYNRADWYVKRVQRQADVYLREPAAASDTPADCVTPSAIIESGVRRVRGGGRVVAIPGFPGEWIDERLLADVAHLVRTYRVAITDGYATSGHAASGEHPLGLAVDIVPGRGGSWDDVDRLARWAEPSRGNPRPPFRWVGYDGDANHGRGHHLHLSWDHSPESPGHHPARWVLTLDLGDMP